MMREKNPYGVIGLKKKATLSMEEPCWEKCEQLIRMLLLFVPVLNILDKKGCSLYFFV